MPMSFDAAGNPNMAQLGAIATATASGALPSTMDSADALLARGTHGTAVVTTAMPMGKTVGEINPNAEAWKANDPVWIFTVEVSLPGQAPFPAVFGHRVPSDKIALVRPGMKVAVAVDPANRNQEVAIDWNRSPMSTY